VKTKRPINRKLTITRSFDYPVLTMNLKSIALAVLIASLPAASALAQPAPENSTSPPEFKETPAERDARMAWFRDAKFGMFIHWGLYSQLAGEWRDKTVTGGAEWIQKYLEIPSSQYSTLVQTWNPTNYDAREWVRLMKAAGVKYVCITTKHHDGFCLWPTKTNDDWNVSLTPGGKDLLKPLADACHAEGVQFCIYHSVLDWHHSDWPGRPAFNDYVKGQPDKARFKDYLYGQLRELFTHYGPIGMVWFDGTWDRAIWTSEDGKALEDYTRSLQPSVILDNRSGWVPPQRKLDFKVENAYGYVFAGDYISPEGEVPPTGLPGIDWETCQTMQLPNNWGYNRLVGFRPFADLLHQLVDVTSKGGNMLLNIGPHADGRILPQAQRCLEKFADWMAVNAESIHGTRASPFQSLPFNGRSTQKPGVLYLHVFTWPQSGKLTVPASNTVKRAWLLADKNRAALTTVQSARGIEISLPKSAPDPIDSVVVVEIEGQPKVLPGARQTSLGKPVEVSSVWPGREGELKKDHLTDGKLNTIWATEERARAGWVTVDLEQDAEVFEALLSDAPYGRTQEFSLEAKLNGEWKKIASGTTIGNQLRLNFEPVKARYFRLNIQKASDTPVVAEFQLFGQ
jgi:alpha-L-fucosidase